VFVVLATSAVHPKLGLLLVKRESNRDELALVVAVAVVDRHHDARITNLHLGPSTLSDRVDAKQTITPVQGENGKEVQKEGRCGGGRVGRGRDDGELHREHLTTGGHPGSRDDLVPERGDVLDGLIIHQVCGAFDLDDGLVCADGVMAVLEVEAESKMGSVLEKDVTNGAVNDVIDKWGFARDIRLFERRKIVVTDVVDEGGHGEANCV